MTAEHGSTIRAGIRAGRRRQVLLGALGVGYLVLAVIGFGTVGWGKFGPEKTVRMLGFLGVSTLACIVHAFVGAVLTAAALRNATRVLAAPGIVAFLALAVFGAVAQVAGGAGDPLNTTWWNVGLYAASAVVCGYVVFSSAARAE